MLRLVGGAETRNGLVPHTGCQIKIRRDISTAGVPPEEQGIPAPHQAPQSRTLLPGREVPIASDCKTSRIWLREREATRVPVIPLKGTMNRLTQIHSL